MSNKNNYTCSKHRSVSKRYKLCNPLVGYSALVAEYCRTLWGDYFITIYVVRKQSGKLVHYTEVSGRRELHDVLELVQRTADCVNQDWPNGGRALDHLAKILQVVFPLY